MCQISDKLKLCTCGPDKDPEELDNYWELHYYNNGRNQLIMGDPMFPLNFFVCKEHHEANRELICQLLNEGNCFDFPYQPQEKDHLVFYLTPILPSGTEIPDASNDKLEYEYEYRRGKWRIHDLGPFDLMNLYVRKAKGEVRNAFIVLPAISG